MTISRRPFTTVIFLVCLLLAGGCVMQNSIEASGGLFTEEMR